MQDDIQAKELLLEKLRLRMIMAEEKANDLKKSFESLCGMLYHIFSCYYLHLFLPMQSNSYPLEYYALIHTLF